ncbi:glycosyltransferase family 32 protein [Dysosmobacter sp. Sow4_B12]|uniref:glycosyltransferase family 32 protein n=1 Tax=Dysosmobacter sp. Sow4_B12 TaxID=3438777 RepID=UPI003F8EE0C5
MSIPKVIHYCWFGKGEIPERDQRCIESWRKYCPQYEIIEWNEDNYDVTQIPYMKEAYDARRWGFVPDFARMDIVYRHGGIYMDTDVELLRPLDDLLEYSGYVGLEADSNCIGFGSGFGAEKGSPVLKELCDYYRTLHFTSADGTQNLLPNPVIVTEHLRNKGFVFPQGEISRIEDFTVFPAEYFCPQNFTSGKSDITDKSYSIHHYHASWLTEKEKEELRKYHRYTKLFGERNGELVYQFRKTMDEGGIRLAIKKAEEHLKKKNR